VADFGIAYLEGLTHLTQTNAISGTAHYISPEQAQGKRVDARTDIYSLGVVLYEMLTGRVPFDGGSLIDVALHHVQDQPIPVRRLQPGISAQTESLVARALAKDPAQRFASAAEMRGALERARAARTVQTERTEQSLAPGMMVERVPRPADRTQVSQTPPDRTAKLGAGVVGRRPRMRQEEKRSRWWMLAVPVLLLALVGGALAVRSLSGGGTVSPPASTASGGGHPSTKSTPRAGAPASTSRGGSSHSGAPESTSTSGDSAGGNGAPAVVAPRKTSTSRPATVAPATTPVATKVPIAAATTVPTTPPAPAVVPPGAITRPTQPSNAAPSSSGAGSPDAAVLNFYNLVSQHQFASAANLWSSNMKANYPPSTNIYGRFDNTQQISVRITSVTQSGNTATVGVALAERTAGGVSGYAGSWNLVRGSGGWLLDSVSLSPIRVSTGAGPVEDTSGHGDHKGNKADQGNG
jgi:serine/threonine-protein kinase